MIESLSIAGQAVPLACIAKGSKVVQIGAHIALLYLIILLRSD